MNIDDPAIKNWLAQSGITYNQNEEGASKPGNYTTSYGPLWDAANPMYGGINKSEDMSPEQYMQSIYGAATDPSYGSVGLNYGDISSGTGFFSGIPRVTLPDGKSYARVGSNVDSMLRDPQMSKFIAQNGGPGAMFKNDPQYGMLMDISNPAYQQMSEAQRTRNGGLWNTPLPYIAMMATMAAGGAYMGAAGAGEGAAAGAGEAGAAYGGTGAFDSGIGMNGVYDYTSPALEGATSGTAGGTVSGTGANGMSFSDLTYDPLSSTNPLSSMDFSQAASGVGSSNALLNPELASSFAGDPSIWAAAAQNAASSGLLSSLTQKVGEQAAKTLLGRLMNGQGTSDDYSRLLGALGPAALGYIGGTQQTNALNQMQDKYLALGQPSRDRLEASYQPGFSLMNEPGFKDAMDQSSSSVLNNLSAKGGNPYDNPGAVTQANKYMFGTVALPQLNTYRSQNASSGGLGVNTAGTAGMAGASSTGNALNAVSFGANNLLNPQPTIEDLMRLQAQLGQQSGSQYRLNQGSGF